MPTIPLMVDLAPAEEKLLTEQLTKALDAREEIKAAATAAAADFRSRLQGIDARIHELKEQIKSGRAAVDTEVDERPGPNGVIELFRAGTDEKVGERPMRDADRQGTLFGADAEPQDLTDEQGGASTPAEAEALRTKRLAEEHAERMAAWLAGARQNVTVSALDGGGFLAALMLEAVEGEEPKALRETGETEEAAKEAVLKIYEESLPKFEPPAATWDEVQAAGAEAAATEDIQEETGAAEVERLVAEQDADAAADAPKTLLKPPKGKRGKRMKVVDEAGTEIPIAPAETPLDPDGSFIMEQPLCPPACDVDHAHTEARTAF